MSASHLSIRETRDHEWLRLHLIGELDIASSPVLDERLSELSADGRAVRLDLSRLEFIDSAGLHALVRAMESAGDDGRRLQIDRHVNVNVTRVFRLVHFERLISGHDGKPA